MGSLWQATLSDLGISCSTVCTFSFHPDFVLGSREGQPRRNNRLFATFITDKSFVDMNAEFDIRYFDSGGQSLLTTDNECEQVELIRTIAASKNLNNAGAPDPGPYTFAQNNCGNWARVMIERSSLVVPEAALSWNAGIGMRKGVAPAIGGGTTFVGRRMVDGLDFLIGNGGGSGPRRLGPPSIRR